MTDQQRRDSDERDKRQRDSDERERKRREDAGEAEETQAEKEQRQRKEFEGSSAPVNPNAPQRSQMSDEERQQREQREQEAKQQREGRNAAAEKLLEAQGDPEPGDVLEVIQQLTVIYLQGQGSDKLALSHIAKALLLTLKYKAIGEMTTDATLLHQHGRNVVPGTKTHLPEYAEVPREIRETRRDRPVEQWEIDEARDREQFAAEGGDPELLRAEQTQKRQEEEQKRKDEEQQKAKDRARNGGTKKPGPTEHEPAQPDQPTHQPNPPQQARESYKPSAR